MQKSEGPLTTAQGCSESAILQSDCRSYDATYPCSPMLKFLIDDALLCHGILGKD